MKTSFSYGLLFHFLHLFIK